MGSPCISHEAQNSTPACAELPRINGHKSGTISTCSGTQGAANVQPAKGPQGLKTGGPLVTHTWFPFGLHSSLKLRSFHIKIKIPLWRLHEPATPDSHFHVVTVDRSWDAAPFWLYSPQHSQLCSQPWVKWKLDGWAGDRLSTALTATELSLYFADQDWHNFSMKNQVVITLVFAGHMVSVAMIQLCCYSAKTVRDNM